MINFSGKVAVVGGAGSGIGEASVRLFASLGAKVVVGDIAIAAAEKVAKEINDQGGAAIALPFNLHDEASIKKMMDDTVAHYGRLDVLHANAADLSPDVMQHDKQIHNMDPAIWDRIFHGNCTGTMLCAKHAIPHMLAAGGGSIVLTASVTGTRGDFNFSAYSSSKAALFQLVRLIATQYGKRGIRANAVLPGLTMTRAVSGMPQWFKDIMLAESLTPQLAQPIDIAHGAVFLASDAARMITGQELRIDGGEAAHWAGIGQIPKEFAQA